MRGMQPAKRTIFIQLQFVWSVFLIFSRRIVSTLAGTTCKSYGVSH